MTAGIADVVAELQCRVGEEVTPQCEFEISPVAVARYREALGIPFDGAQSVPLSYLLHLVRPSVDVHDERRPPTPFGAPLTKGVKGGSTITLGRLPRLGESLSVREFLHSAAVREGRNGTIAIVVTRTEARVADETVTTIDNTMVYRGWSTR